MKAFGFDIDGVLYDFHDVVYRYLKLQYGIAEDYTTFWREERKRYYANDNTGRFNKTFWDNFLKIPIIYDSLDIPKRDLQVINTIAEKFDEIIYVTYRPIETKHTTIEWMMHNKLPFNDNLYFAKDKSIPVLKHQCNYFIDDDVLNVQRLENITNAILMKKSYHTKEDLELTHISYLQDLLEIEL